MGENKYNMSSDDYLPLRDVVFNNLRDSILKGNLKPGDRLMENRLADQLGVSRTPVREALRMLEIEHLVELIPRKGAQVLGLSKSDLNNVLQIRSYLEALAVKLACEKFKDEDIEILHKYNEGFIQAFESKSFEEAAACDEGFHNIIFKSTENDRLIQILDNLKVQIYRYRIAYIKMTESLDTIIKHHNDIVYALEHNMPNLGENVARDHVNYQSEFILRNMK